MRHVLDACALAAGVAGLVVLGVLAAQRPDPLRAADEALRKAPMSFSHGGVGTLLMLMGLVWWAARRWGGS